MTFRLRFLNGAFPLLREHVPIDNKKPQHYPAALLVFSSKIKVCCLRMSAVAGVCGWPHIRWPPLLPVHIHLTIESGKRKPSGECFRFPLRWARWNVLSREGASSGWQDTPHTAQISFLGGVFPSARRTGWNCAIFFICDSVNTDFFKKAG